MRPNILLTTLSHKSIAAADQADKSTTKPVAGPDLWNQPRVKRQKTEEMAPMNAHHDRDDPHDIIGDRFNYIVVSDYSLLKKSGRRR